MTRFRAYQLSSAGSSFSYFDGLTFTLGEARYNADNRPSILNELSACGKQRIDTLHVTSWDQDHFSISEFESLLNELHPGTVELPKYLPDDVTVRQVNSILKRHSDPSPLPRAVNIRQLNSAYIGQLSFADVRGTSDVHFDYKSENLLSPNNLSSIKLFRSSGFNVLSVGDVELPEIQQWLCRDPILRTEVDVMILAHHGANNGFTNRDLLEKINPSLVVCTSNYGNQFEHPRPEIRNLHDGFGIPLLTTKTGDVIVSGDMIYKYWNLSHGSQMISSSGDLFSKKLIASLSHQGSPREGALRTSRY